MKKLLIAIFIGTIGLSAHAQGFHHGYRGGFHHHHYGGWGWGGWVAPAVVGGVIGYELARPPVVVQQPPVFVQPPMVVGPTVTTQPVNCTAWTQIQNSDGSITTQRTCQ